MLDMVRMRHSRMMCVSCMHAYMDEMIQDRQNTEVGNSNKCNGGNKGYRKRKRKREREKEKERERERKRKRERKEKGRERERELLGLALFKHEHHLISSAKTILCISALGQVVDQNPTTRQQKIKLWKT